MTWAMPDRCDSNARQLIASSALLGQALKYNKPSATDAASGPNTDHPAATTQPDVQSPAPDSANPDAATDTQSAAPDDAPAAPDNTATPPPER
jgi:hypothetical protein